MAALPDPGPEENLPVDPDKRNGGCGIIFDDKLYVWGGETLDVLLPDDDLELEEGEEPLEAVEVIENLPRPDDPKHPFDVLDLSRMAWSQQSTSAKHPGEEDNEIPPEEIPAVGLGSSLLFYPEAECFLLFSGYNDLQFDAKVYCIFPGEWKWDILEPATDVKPTPRYLTGAIIHDNRLCTFGGVSVPIRNGKDPGARYVPKKEDGVVLDYGWNNEYFEMDLQTRTWVAPLDKDAVRPDPIAGCAFTKIDQERALLFGGLGSNGRVNEARLFHFEKKEWSGSLRSASSDRPWPPPTRFPTLTALVPPELVGQRLCGCGPELHQRLVMLWGKENPQLVSKETWLLEIESGSRELVWRKLKVSLKPRSWHIGLPRYHAGSTECQVVVFGGNAHIEGDTGERDNTADLRILQFGVQSLVCSCLAVVAESSRLLGMASRLALGSKLQRMISAAHETLTNTPALPEISFV